MKKELEELWYIFRDSNLAFDNYIKKTWKKPIDWMYMYSTTTHDYFKHFDTRDYKVIEY